MDINYDTNNFSSEPMDLEESNIINNDELNEENNLLNNEDYEDEEYKPSEKNENNIIKYNKQFFNLDIIIRNL